MCCNPITSLNLSGPILLSSPLKFGVWYKWSLKSSPYLWINSCSILLEFGLPRDPRRWSSNMVHLTAGFEIPESASSNKFTWQRKPKQIKIARDFPSNMCYKGSPLYKHLQLGSVFLIVKNCAWSFPSDVLDHLIDCMWVKGQTSSHIVTDPLIFCSLEDIDRLIALWSWLQILLKGTYKWLILVATNQCVLNWQYTSSASLDPVPKYSDDHTTLLSAVCTPCCKDDIMIKLKQNLQDNYFFFLSFLPWGLHSIFLVCRLFQHSSQEAGKVWSSDTTRKTRTGLPVYRASPSILNHRRF